jgi:hypothetical protein
LDQTSNPGRLSLAASGGAACVRGGAPPETRAQTRRGVLRRQEGLKEVGGGAANTEVGMILTQRHRRAVVRGEMARRWHCLTPVSNYAQPRVGKREIRGVGGWLPRGESPSPLNGDKGTVMARVDDDATTATWMEIQ